MLLPIIYSPLKLYNMLEIVIGLLGSIFSRIFDSVNEKIKSTQQIKLMQEQRITSAQEHEQLMKRLELDLTSKKLDIDNEVLLKTYTHDSSPIFSGKTGFGSMLQDVSSFIRTLIRPAMTFVILISLIIDHEANADLMNLAEVMIGWWFGDRSIKIFKS